MVVVPCITISYKLKIHYHNYNLNSSGLKHGAQWLSCRVLNLGSKGHKFNTHREHCFVFMRKSPYILLSTGSAQENVSTLTLGRVKDFMRHT